MNTEAKIPLQTQREIDRWYPLIDHPVQLRLVRAIPEGIRFPIVPSGRRSGKTERFKRFISKLAMATPNQMYFAGAPTFQQAKKIFWNDLKLLTFASAHSKPPSESELKLFMPNGTEVHVIGLDKPQRIEGVNWTGGGIDEIADVKSESVEGNIMPALNTVDPRRPDYRPWCWFLGVPDGYNHFYRMAEMAKSESNPEYGLYHWKSAEILPADVIEAAKRTMSPLQYRVEYEASFENATGRIYSDYSGANHTTETIKPHEQLHWSHDQNYTPLSSSVSVLRDESMYILDEIVLMSAEAQQSANEFCEKFKDHKNKNVVIYGDPYGRHGEKHGHKSDYIVIEKVLSANGWKHRRKVPPSHPPIKDRQNSVRSRILSADGERRLFVNPQKAPWSNEGLATVQFKEGSTFQEDDKNKYQHITTAIGYQIHKLWPSGVSAGKSANTSAFLG